MVVYTALVERCSETGLLVGHVPGFPGAHSQGATADELRDNLGEIIAMLREDEEPPVELAVETEQEVDGRWIAEVREIPGALAYGVTRYDAIARVRALAAEVLADRREHGECGPGEPAEA